MAFETAYKTTKANNDFQLWNFIETNYESSEIIMDTEFDYMKKETSGRTI